MGTAILWHNPWAFGLLAVALPFLLWLTARERRRAATLRFPLLGLLRQGPRGLAGLWWFPHFLRLVAVTLAVTALARPQIAGNRARDLTVEGIDIVVALDISTSMNAADFRPRDRITVAKDVLRRFIEGRTDDRIGLVVFAGEAYTQAPLTLDYHVLSEILGSVRTGLVEDGTAIGNALATAINRLRDSDAKSKVIILITDGDNNAGNISPMEAAAIAKEFGIRVYTIMVGKGGLVPFPSGPDFFGKPTYREVEIPVNPDLLKSIARETRGSFYNAVDRQTLESGLNDILNQLEKTKLYQAGGYQNMTEVYQPFLVLACLALLLEVILSSTRLRSFP
ncbi:MAG: vWA domain-containing protein [Myxococcales bacterium]|jgi:Ca-activated chloride channel family protein